MSTEKHPSPTIQEAYFRFTKRLIGFRVLKGNHKIEKFEAWAALLNKSGKNMSLLSLYTERFFTNRFEDYRIVSKFDLLDGAKKKSRFHGKF